jgi:nicotinate phosphoribosyltransferase
MAQVMVKGVTTQKSTPLESAAYARDRLTYLAPEHKRFEFPHIYKVGISQELLNLRAGLVEEFQRRSTQ